MPELAEALRAETGTTTKMTRLRGRAPLGERLRMYAPFGHTRTFVPVSDVAA